MIDNQAHISEKLKSFFDERNITQQDIAVKMGVSQPAVSALLNGKPFGKKLAQKWGDEFGIKPNWLLTGEGEMLKDAKPKEEVIATDSVVIPNDVWEVIKNQAESIKIKDRQTTDTLEVIKKQAESLKTKDQQTSKVIEMLEEQLKKSQRVQAQFHAANSVVVEDE